MAMADRRNIHRDQLLSGEIKWAMETCPQKNWQKAAAFVRVRILLINQNHVIIILTVCG